MRALASAVLLQSATCFGPGVGPLAVGMLKAGFGNEAVRYSLLSVAIAITPLFVWAARLILRRHRAAA
jgi:hypothetical protein